MYFLFPTSVSVAACTQVRNTETWKLKTHGIKINKPKTLIKAQFFNADKTMLTGKNHRI